MAGKWKRVIAPEPNVSDVALGVEPSKRSMIFESILYDDNPNYQKDGKPFVWLTGPSAGKTFDASFWYDPTESK